MTLCEPRTSEVGRCRLPWRREGELAGRPKEMGLSCMSRSRVRECMCVQGASVEMLRVVERREMAKGGSQAGRFGQLLPKGDRAGIGLKGWVERELTDTPLVQSLSDTLFPPAMFRVPPPPAAAAAQQQQPSAGSDSAFPSTTTSDDGPSPSSSSTASSPGSSDSLSFVQGLMDQKRVLLSCYSLSSSSLLSHRWSPKLTFCSSLARFFALALDNLPVAQPLLLRRSWSHGPSSVPLLTSSPSSH